MKLTLQWLQDNKACPEGVDFAIANNLLGVEMRAVIQACADNGKAEYGVWLLKQTLTAQQLKDFAVAVITQVGTAHNKTNAQITTVCNAVKNATANTVIPIINAPLKDLFDLAMSTAAEGGVIAKSRAEYETRRQSIGQQLVAIGLGLLVD